MPKFKAVYLFDKIYDFEGIKEIEAKDIKEAVENPVLGVVVTSIP